MVFVSHVPLRFPYYSSPIPSIRRRTLVSTLLLFCEIYVKLTTRLVRLYSERNYGLIMCLIWPVAYYIRSWLIEDNVLILMVLFLPSGKSTLGYHRVVYLGQPSSQFLLMTFSTHVNTRKYYCMRMIPQLLSVIITLIISYVR